MCGIAGAWLPRDHPPDPDLGARMIAPLMHRGPDDRGVQVLPRAVLAHARLSILDLSPAGHQPMANPDQTVWIVFNGEIYNFLSLRGELEALGHRFRSGSDTEVLLHAYEQWGLDCLERLAGMFAFAIWDTRRERLWLVRDRLGIKPLFYAQTEAGLFFASEAKGVLASGAVSREVDFQALSYFLGQNYTPAPWTLFRTIRQLPPGHYLLADDQHGVVVKEYWDLAFPVRRGRGRGQWLEEFHDLMHRVVGQHLLSDVPLGAFLSGGVDSSSVAWWMKAQAAESVHTFTISFAERAFDEAPYAELVARALGTRHERFRVSLDFEDLLPRLVWHAEEPTADSSMLAMYCLARETRQRVTVALAGDGADELLAGYETYPAHYLLRLYQAIPGGLRRALEPLVLDHLPVREAKVGWEEKIRRFLAGARYSPAEAHGAWRMIFGPEARAELLRPLAGQPGVEADFLALYRAAFARRPEASPLNRMLYVDLRHYLPNDMLVKVDRMTMAHGLEARVPFLDHRVVEFCAQAPESLKLRGLLQGKHLLKAAMRGRLPRPVLTRRKAGFNMPNAHWLRTSLRDFAGDLLSPASLKPIGWFDENYVQRLFDDHQRGRADHSHQIWGLLVLVLWWRQFQSPGRTA